MQILSQEQDELAEAVGTISETTLASLKGFSSLKDWVKVFTVVQVGLLLPCNPCLQCKIQSASIDVTASICLEEINAHVIAGCSAFV